MSGLDGGLPFTRRAFLGAVGASAAVVAVPSAAQALLPRPDAVPTSLILRRREDLLRVTLIPVGMTIDPAAGEISLDTGVQRGRLRVDFGPQVIVEQAAEIPPDGPAHPIAPVRARLSGSSWVVFYAGGDVPLTLSALLAWARSATAVDPVAGTPDGLAVPGESPAKPNGAFTSLEMPWWLRISPNVFSAWTQQVAPKRAADRTELFHTRLALLQFGADPLEGVPEITVRGAALVDPDGRSLIANPAMEPAEGVTVGYPFPMIPSPRDRADIVRLTTMTQSAGSAVQGGLAKAVPARISLSALGAQLQASGSWNEPFVSNMTSWQQRTWQGRDTYAKVVRQGFLYPFGLRAAWVEEGVRRWVRDSVGGAARPFWYKTTRVVVTQPTLDLRDGEQSTAAGKRGAIFRSITCRTLVTPELVGTDPGQVSGGGWAGKRVCFVQVPGPNGTRQPFQFDFTGIDANGDEVAFTMPLMFAEDASSADGVGPTYTAQGSQALRDFYNGKVGADAEKFRMARFNGQAVGYADAAGIAPRSAEGLESLATRVQTDGIIFDILAAAPGAGPALPLVDATATGLDLWQAQQPLNMPIIKEARVVVEDVSRIAGQTVASVLAYPQEYLKSGLDEAKNKGRIFLANVAASPTQVGMDAARAGGVVVPTMDLAGLSATVGTVFGTVESLSELAADGTITPGEALAAIKLLGGISLADILPVTFPAVDGDKPSSKALAVSSELVDAGRATERVVTTMSMSWKASELVPSGIAEQLLGLEKASLTLTLVSQVPTAGGVAAWSVAGAFNDFVAALVPIEGAKFIYVSVKRLGFTAGSSQGSDIDVDIDRVVFGNALAFLAELAEKLPFGDNLSVAVSSAGITAGLSVGVPSIALGAFTLTGIRVNTGLTLPFGSDPVRFRFGMSSTDDPFGLTVLGIGGGGWFRNDIGLDGVEFFDCGMFIQGKLALDFGVASGSLSVRVGLQYSMGAPAPGDPDVCTLVAFYRIDGSVGVLGIVSVGVTVYVGLGIELPIPIPRSPQDALQVTLHGEARVSVKIKLCFYSKTVGFTVKRSFKGSDIPFASDVIDTLPLSQRRGPLPRSSATGVTFAESTSPDAWRAYCGGFA